MNARLRIAAMCGVASLLGAAPLGVLFETWAWFGFAILTVGVITGASIAARRLSAPGGLVPLINLGVLGLLVSALFGNGSEILGVIPTSGTIGALRQLLSAASSDIVQLAVPVPTRRGLLLITVLGIGAVAIVVDALAVSLRRSALTGLPLLAMFAVPVAVSRDGIGWVAFTVSATGYLLLLLSEGRERITRWGRPFSGSSTATSSDGDGWRPDPMQSSPVAAVGRRIGAAAIGIAVVAPVITPFVHAGSLAGLTGSGGGGPGGPGGGYSAGVNPITSLRGQLVRPKPIELLRVRTNDAQPFYLRLTTLDTFTLDGWKQGSALDTAQAKPVRDGLPGTGISAAVPIRKIHTSVQVRGLAASQYLPAYAVPTKIGVTGDWRYDRRTGTVFTRRTNTRDLSYTFDSVAPDRSSADLLDLLKRAPEADPRLQAGFGAVNVPNAPQIKARVDAIVAGKKTPYEKTLTLYNYFRDGTKGFRYTTSTSPGNSGSALLDFLDNKAGYCEQYASAMAAMARYAGVPARVAIGYTKGQRKVGYWSVTTNDAHAWVEVYFADAGWIAWDPTPLGNTGRQTFLPYSATGPDNSGTGAGTTSSPQQEGETNKAHQISAREDREGRPSAAAAPLAPKQAPPADHTVQWLLGTLVAVLLALAPLVCRLVARLARLRHAAGRDPRAAVNAAWDEVMATAYDLGQLIDEARTPRVAARRLATDMSLDETAAATLRLLAAAEEQARYSARRPAANDLVATVRALRSAMLASANRRAALRARVFPPSAIRFAGQRSGMGIADVLDRMDAALARGRRVALERLSFSRS
ncbi:MAG: DUF3488 and transglutaminase-like domain-containing protein [Pseudonocardiales bacterium]